MYIYIQSNRISYLWAYYIFYFSSTVIFHIGGIQMNVSKISILVTVFVIALSSLVYLSDQISASETNEYLDEEGGAKYQVIDGKNPKALVVGWDGIHKDIKIKTSVTVDGIEYNVNKVKSTAFKGEGITSIELPDSDSEIDIENNSFEGCTALTSVYFGTSVTVIGNSLFKGCTSLQSFTTSAASGIGTYAFSGCIKLTEVSLKSNIKTISESAFLRCSSLTTISLPESVTTLGPSVFRECTALRTVNLPENISTISSTLFYECSSLESISIPGSVQSFGLQAFYNCTSLTSVTFNEGIKSIQAKELFAGCAFTEVSIPSTVEEMYVGETDGKNAKHEQWPSVLESINVDSNNPKFKSVDGVLYSKDGMTLYLCPRAKVGSLETAANIGNMACWNSSLTSVKLLDGCTSVAYSAFSKSSIESIILPDTLKEIGSYAFSNCKSLKEINLPKNITKIEEGVFSDCTELSITEIPSGIVSIGAHSFNGCTNVKLTSLPDSLNTIGLYAFNNTGIENIEIGTVSSVSVNKYSFGGDKLKCVTLGKVTPADNLTEADYRYLFYGPNLEKINTTSDFTLWSQKGVLSIGSNGQLYSCLPTASGKITIPSEVSSIIGAFRDCKKITEIEFESLDTTVTINSGSIYHGSFEGCIELTSITLPNVIIAETESDTFNGCTNLSSISIKTIDRIPDRAFYNTNLKDLSISDYSNTKYVGVRAFMGMDITSFDASGMNIEYEAFKNCSKLTEFKTDSKTLLKTGALENTAIKKLTIYVDSAVPITISYGTSNLSGVASRLCYGCKDLSEVEFIKGTSEKLNVGESSFEGCTSLVKISVPDTLSRIWFENNAFKGSGLTTLNLSSTEIYIRSGCFYGCTNLKEVILDSEKKYNVSENVFYNCSALEKVSIANAGRFYLSAFYGCTSLNTLKIGSTSLGTSSEGHNFDPNGLSVKTIDIGAYEGKSESLLNLLNYTSVENFICSEYNNTYSVVGGAVYILSDGAPVTLLMCSKTVTELTIPDSVKTIGEHAFDGCTALKKVKFPNSLETYSYSSVNLPKIYLIDGSELSNENLETAKGHTFSIRDDVGKLFLEHTISFDAGDGSPVDPIVGPVSAVVTEPNAPVMTGYSFQYWTLNGEKYSFTTIPAENITLKAVWKVNQYTISFNSDGGSDISKITQDYGSSVTAPKGSVKTGYSFQYWTLNGEKYTFTTIPAENITLKAVWKVNQYTITFDTQGGSVIPSITQDYGTAITMPADPIKDGYSFLKWDTIPAEIPAYNLLIKAIWVKNIVADTESGAVTVDAEDSNGFILTTDTKTVTVNIADNISIKVENAEGLTGLLVSSNVKAITNTSNKVGTAYKFIFTADSVQYNGKMLVTLPYVVVDGKQPVVYYWDGTESQKMNVVSSTDTSVTFETFHNSEYIVASEEVSQNSDSGSIMWVVIVAIIVILVASIFVIRYKKAA